MGRSRAAFYSRFLVSARSPRIMSFASAGGAIFVTTLADPSTKRARPPARGFATRGDGGLGRRQFRPVERRVITPDRKQNATQPPGQRDHRDAATAARARRATQALSVPLLGWRQQTHAACISRLRSSRGPAFVMCPRCRRSAELSSRGTRPIAALTWPAWANRSWRSTKARNVVATIRPMPGTLRSRAMIASLAVRVCRRASSAWISIDNAAI